MKKNLNFHLLLLFALFLLSCQKQTIFINQDGYKPRVSIEGEIHADSVAKIYLTYTQNYYGYVSSQKKIQYVEDAKTVVTNNGVEEVLELVTVNQDSSFKYNFTTNMWEVLFKEVKYYRGHNICKKGQTYNLKVSHQGKEFSSEITVPVLNFPKTQAKISIDSVNGGRFHFLEIDVKDSLGIGDYYRVTLNYIYKKRATKANTGLHIYEILDSIMQRVKVISPAFSDELADGQLIKIKANPPHLYDYAYIYNYNHSTNPDTSAIAMFVKVEYLDKEFGKYLTSISSQGVKDPYWSNLLYTSNLPSSTQDPFIEPTILYSNIKNGIGIFGSTQTIDTFTIYFPRKY